MRGRSWRGAVVLAFALVAFALLAGAAAAAPPANDPFYGAQTVSGVEGSVSGTNVEATADWNEPWSPVAGGVSVWYVWTSPRNGSVTFTAAGAGFTPAVTAFVGDAPDHVVLLGSGLGSATFDATQDQTYRIAVDGQNGGTGPFDLSWGYAPTGAAANDYLADAQALDGPSGSVAGSTANATVELGEPDHSGSCCNTGGHSIWYRWTAPAGGSVFFDTRGSSFDTVMRIYSGSTMQSLVGQGWYDADANPWSSWSRAFVRGVQAGATYLVAVDGANGASGDVRLTWRSTVATGDLEQPQVQLVSPEQGANVTGTLTFRADASDNEGVDRVEYTIAPSGSGFPWYVGEAYAPPYEVTLDTSVLPAGLYSVWATAFDASGNQLAAGATITVGDPPPPTLTVPAPITREATSSRGAVVKFSATARDWNGAALPVTCKPASGTTFPLGTTKVSCSATDSVGHTTTKAFTVRVVDTTPPVVQVPGDVAVDATNPNGATVSYAATASDVVSGALVPSCTPAAGDTFAIGDTRVACSATDGAGNTGTASFAVHVRGAREQLDNMRAWLAAQAVDTQVASRLDGELADVEKQLDAGRQNAVCGGLAEFVADVNRESGKRLTSDQAARLAGDAVRVRSVVGC
jgi:Bacterial Ig domain/HYR domain